MVQKTPDTGLISPVTWTLLLDEDPTARFTVTVDPDQRKPYTKHCVLESMKGRFALTGSRPGLPLDNHPQSRRLFVLA